MSITEFGRRSFIAVKGLKERIREAEKEIQMRNYRGLTKEGKWVYGWYAEIKGISFIISKNAVLTKPRGFIDDFEQVIPETVGQQTGLRDKTNTKVYDKDIVKTPGGQILPIDIVNLIDGDSKFRSIPIEDCEIIGNKWEKPELMERDNEKVL